MKTSNTQRLGENCQSREAKNTWSMTESSGWIVRVTSRNHPPGTLVLSLWEDLDPQLDQGFRGTLNLTD